MISRGPGHFVGPPADQQAIGAGLLGDADRTVRRRVLVFGNIQQLAEDRQHFLGPGILQVEGLQPGRQRSLGSFDASSDSLRTARSRPAVSVTNNCCDLANALDRSLRSEQLLDFGLDVFGPDLVEVE